MPDFDISEIQNLFNDLKELISSNKSQKQLSNSPSNKNINTTLNQTQVVKQKNTYDGVYQAPVKGSWKSSGGFNLTMRRPNGRVGHEGVDIRAAMGTLLYPIANDGVVSGVGVDLLGGNYITINYPNNIKTYYAHCSEIMAKKGDKVDKNTPVAKIGDSGNAKGTFPHCHCEISVNGVKVDPANYFPVPPYTEVSKDEIRILPGSRNKQADIRYLYKICNLFNKDVVKI